jgi:hypothetical protein
MTFVLLSQIFFVPGRLQNVLPKRKPLVVGNSGDGQIFAGRQRACTAEMECVIQYDGGR